MTPRDRSPFRIPVHVYPNGVRVWELWAWVLDKDGTLLGFSATEQGANSISTAPGLPGKAIKLTVTESEPEAAS